MFSALTHNIMCKFVDQMKNDYTELTSEVEAQVSREMGRLRELKERMKNLECLKIFWGVPLNPI